MHQLSPDDRLQLTREIVDLLDDWGVSATNRVNLLGMSEGTKARSMAKYGVDFAFPADQEVYIRIEHLIGIADALRTSYPRNAHMGKFWLNQKNKRFANRTPLICMLEDGLNGIVTVRVHLDCAYDWHIDETSAGKINNK